MGLNGIINDLQGNTRTGNFDLRDFAFGDLIADCIHHVGRLHGQKARHFNIGAGFGDALFPNAVIGNAFAEGCTGQQACAHFFKRALSHADCPHAMVDAARAKTPLRDFKAAPFTEQKVLSRYAYIFQNNFGMSVRCVIKPEYRQHADNFNAGGIQRHQNLRLLLVQRGVGVRFAHHNCD